jgi:hypothetical protein
MFGTFRAIIVPEWTPGGQAMTQQRATVLADPTVRAALKQAWEDSQSGVSGRHEEGGFILRDAAGNLSVVRWPKGAQNSITLPSHPDCKVGESDIIATFHTHPNTGSDYLQEPGETDRRAVRDDPDLKGECYAGEFVISQEKIYHVKPNGEVSQVGETREIL